MLSLHLPSALCSVSHCVYQLVCTHIKFIDLPVFCLVEISEFAQIKFSCFLEVAIQYRVRILTITDIVNIVIASNMPVST